MTVLAVTSWHSNAELIADAVVPLGYIKPTDRVIDVTFGRGIWWKKYQHPSDRFIGCVESMTGTMAIEWNGSLRFLPDFRDMRTASNDYQEQFDVVAFDPPYVAMGGRKTSGIPDFMGRFGLETAAATPRELHWENMKGLRECQRICRPGGLILTKCCNYISSGKLFAGAHMVWDQATQFLGLELVDEFTMVGHVRSQPKDGPCKKCAGSGLWGQQINDADGEPMRMSTTDCPTCDGSGRKARRVVHARQNASTLFVFRKARR